VRKVLLTILSVVALDQILKIWIKLSFFYGENVELIPGWLDLQFVENPGMAFGWMFPGTSGKLRAKHLPYHCCYGHYHLHLLNSRKRKPIKDIFFAWPLL